MKPLRSLHVCYCGAPSPRPWTSPLGWNSGQGIPFDPCQFCLFSLAHLSWLLRFLWLQVLPSTMCILRPVLTDRKGLNVVPISNKKEKQSQPHHQRGLTAVSIHVILGHPSHTPSEGPARLGTHKHVINSIFFRVIAHLLCARHTYECTKIDHLCVSLQTSLDNKIENAS